MNQRSILNRVGQNKTKVGLKDHSHAQRTRTAERQNKTKVGLKVVCKASITRRLLSQNKTKVGLKAY